jgi:hypothetical protein
MLQVDLQAIFRQVFLSEKYPESGDGYFILRNYGFI